jgi:hypothetical protein
VSQSSNRTAGSDSRCAKPTLETLESRENPTVLYYGGNLLTAVDAQAVFYGSGWSNNTSDSTTASAFVKDLTQSAYMDALKSAGYGVGRGTTETAAFDTRSLGNGSTITDASIQAALKADITAGTVAALNNNSLYIVYVQPNVAVNLGNGQGTTQQGILGYHGAFTGPNGQAVRYAVVAYPGGTVGNSSLGTSAIDQLTAVTSHETAEAVTDPDVNYSTLGWYDPQRGEIGDIEENNPNAYVRMDGYLVQEVANQQDQLLSLNLSPPVSPPAGSTAATTTTLSAGTVHYHGWYATVQLTVTVKPNSGTVAPGGTVELIYNGQVLGSATLHLVNGVETATFNVIFYANGDYPFTVQYEGTSQFLPSTSNQVNVIV